MIVWLNILVKYSPYLAIGKETSQPHKMNRVGRKNRGKPELLQCRFFTLQYIAACSVQPQHFSVIKNVTCEVTVLFNVFKLLKRTCKYTSLV